MITLYKITHILQKRSFFNVNKFCLKRLSLKLLTCFCSFEFWLWVDLELDNIRYKNKMKPLFTALLSR